jgi:phosphate transport system substrate-binding protein
MSSSTLSLLLLALFGAFDGTVVEEPTEVLTWRGCGISKKAFMSDAAQAYEAETGVEIRLTGGGATLGIQAAGEGGSDFGGTCRHCLPSMQEDALPLALTLVAWDALAVITHPSNPVDGITVEQLKGVLTQSIQNWSELGGPDLPIVVVARKGKTSGVGAMLRELVLGDPDFEFGPRVLRLQSSGPVDELVEGVEAAIAVTGISSGRKRAVKALKLDGVAPDAKDIASGKYPYYRPLYLAHAPVLGDRATHFRDWLLGPPGQAIVEKAGTVNLESGLGLMGSFKAFGDTQQITNYQDLQARWKQLEQQLAKRAAQEARSG